MNTLDTLADRVRDAREFVETLDKEIDALQVTINILATSSREDDFRAGLRVQRIYRMRRTERLVARSVLQDLINEGRELAGDA